MAQYNGHRSWNAWNVALWIGNDEPLYRFAVECVRGHTLDEATRRFMAELGGQRTPDGAIYNKTCVREALAGIRESLTDK